MVNDINKCVICQSAPRYQYKHIKFMLCSQCTLDFILRITEMAENGEINLPLYQVAQTKPSNDSSSKEEAS